MCSAYLKCINFLAPVIFVYAMYKYVCMVCVQFACFSACLYTFIQASTNELKSQITTLQTALDEAGEEIAAMKEHEEKLTSQFQVCLVVSEACHI